MSTIVEAKAMADRLSAEDRWELYCWLSAAKDLERFRIEELRRAIAVGIEQADCGEAAPLDVPTIKEDVRQRLAAQRGNFVRLKAPGSRGLCPIPQLKSAQNSGRVPNR